MRPLSPSEAFAFGPDHLSIIQSDKDAFRRASDEAHRVSSYFELYKKIAALSYSNPRFTLLFRGQVRDYRLDINGNKGKRSNLYPSILRVSPGNRIDLLDNSFLKLRKVEDELFSRLSDKPELINIPLVRWAVLQHYEICHTPLLDVTRSLQTALSFACSFGESDSGFLFVLAVPQMSGPVSVSIESMTQAIDLAQICPPDALRPHFQSGVLLGDYPAYQRREETHVGKGFINNDFSCRLLTKFRLESIGAWDKDGFAPTPQSFLYPNQRDELFELLAPVRAFAKAL